MEKYYDQHGNQVDPNRNSHDQGTQWIVFWLFAGFGIGILFKSFLVGFISIIAFGILPFTNTKISDFMEKIGSWGIRMITWLIMIGTVAGVGYWFYLADQ